MIPRRLAVIATIALGLASAAEAQVASASLAAGAVAVRFAERAFNAATLTPTLNLRTGHASASLMGSLSQIAVDTWSRQGTAVLSLYTPVVGPGFLAEMSGTAGGSQFSDGASTAQLLGSLRGHWMGARAALSVGLGGGSMYDGVGWRDLLQGEVAGTWMGQRGQVTLMATPSVTDDTLRYTDILGQVGSSLGRVDLALHLGGRIGAALPIPGGDQALWGGIGVTTWLAPRMALLVGVGAYPVDVTQGFPAGEYASVSLRLGLPRGLHASSVAQRWRQRAEASAAGVSAVRLHRVDGETLELRVQAEGVTRLEVMGDFTGWAPVALRVVEPGRWEGRFVFRGRIVEYLLRSDGGEWLIPLGAEAVTDEFGGRVGRVVLP